jgi:hypothetical protein
MRGTIYLLLAISPMLHVYYIYALQIQDFRMHKFSGDQYQDIRLLLLMWHPFQLLLLSSTCESHHAEDSRQRWGINE